MIRTQATVDRSVSSINTAAGVKRAGPAQAVMLHSSLRALWKVDCFSSAQGNSSRQLASGFRAQLTITAAWRKMRFEQSQWREDTHVTSNDIKSKVMAAWLISRAEGSTFTQA